MTVEEDIGRCLKIVNTGPPLKEDSEEVDNTFYQHLLSYGGTARRKLAWVFAGAYFVHFP